MSGGPAGGPGGSGGPDRQVRDRLVLVLDVADLGTAEATARRLGPWFSTVKVGSELFAAAGPAAFARLRELGFRIFADLKLHDIPTTVERAARVHAANGIDFFTLHAAGGVDMLRAGCAGLAEGARDAGRPTPVSLAVTVLTSDVDTTAFDARLATAREAGCDGVVCSGHEVAVARAAGLRTMVPGVRLAGGAVHDQARVSTPDAILAAGGDWLVVGRAVTAADQPEAAAASVSAAAARWLAGPG